MIPAYRVREKVRLSSTWTQVQCDYKFTPHSSIHPGTAALRYWFNGEDEDHGRELARVRDFGGEPPAPMSHATVIFTALLVSGEFALFAALIAGFVLSILR